MPSLDDQFEHGRIPIKPLPYKNKQQAQCNEFMIDYGEGRSYHMYIVHHSDDTKYIDLTAMIIKDMLPNADINANKFVINIEGEEDPKSLEDIINFIFKRFAYPEDSSGFVPEEDMEKVFSPAAKSVLLRTTDGTILLPVTLADNVYDKDGRTIQERLDDMTRLGFSMSYLYTTQQNQTSYEFDYPFEDYPDFMEVRIGTTFIDKSRYKVEKHYDREKHYKSGTITFLNESIEKGRRIDILWLYNSAYSKDSKVKFMSGNTLADGSVPTCKLEKVSNSYAYNDDTSLATSKALHDLFVTLTNAINSTTDNHVFHCADVEKDNEKSIKVIPNTNITIGDTLIITLASDKLATAKLSIENISGSAPEYQVLMVDGKLPQRRYKKNQVITIKIEGDKAILLDGYTQEIRTSRLIHDCVDQEYNISYKGLSYTNGDLIHVYRNGVRLFQDLDYSINYISETITLYVRTEDGERIIFESLGI